MAKRRTNQANQVEQASRIETAEAGVGLEQSPRTKEVFIVNTESKDMSEIVKAIQEGKEIQWASVEKFFPLPDELVQQMNFKSRENYFVTKSLWEQGKKSPGKGFYGELEVIELIPNNPRNRFKFEAPPDVHMFFPTLEMAKAAEYAGYKYVSRKETRFKQIIPSPEGSQKEGLDPDKVYIHNMTTGRPEHVAMYIPKERYEKHIEALAWQSQRRIRRADEDLTEMKKEAAARAGKGPERFRDIKANAEVKYEREELTQVYVPEKDREE